MTRKIDGGRKYIEAATTAIKTEIPLRQLYIAIHETNPSRQDLQQFANRLNPSRSNPGADMLGLCVAHIPAMHDMTLAEFFGLNE